MKPSGCNHAEFASAVAFSDAKRAGGPVSKDGGLSPGLLYSKDSLPNSLVAGGVIPWGQTKKMK